MKAISSYTSSLLAERELINPILMLLSRFFFLDSLMFSVASKSLLSRNRDLQSYFWVFSWLSLPHLNSGQVLLSSRPLPVGFSSLRPYECLLAPRLSWLHTSTKHLCSSVSLWAAMLSQQKVLPALSSSLAPPAGHHWGSCWEQPSLLDFTIFFLPWALSPNWWVQFSSPKWHWVL